MSKKNYLISTEKTFIDSKTGEMITAETTKTVVRKIDCEHFYMLFNGFAEKVKGINSSAREMFDYFCEQAVWNTGEIYLTQAIREDLSTLLNVSKSMVSKNLRILYEKELLIKKGLRTYISPDIFWKGEQADRRKLLLENAELEITYTIKNKNLVEVEEESQE